MFSQISIQTMIHGIALSGLALVATAVALFYMLGVRPEDAGTVTHRQMRVLTGATGVATVALWLAVVAGTYVIFPAYRATPPEGVTALAAYPRALIMADPGNRWLHTFAMETKEHVPWIAAMLTTAVGAIAFRYRHGMLSDARLRKAGLAFLATSVVLVSYVALLGIFVNKFAPLE